MAFNNLNFNIKEYFDAINTTKLVILITLGLIIVLYWVWITFEETIALTYMTMGIITLLLIFAEKSNPKFVDVILFGEKKIC